MGQPDQLHGHHQAGRESGAGYPESRGKSTPVAGTACPGPMLRDRGKGQQGRSGLEVVWRGERMVQESRRRPPRGRLDQTSSYRVLSPDQSDQCGRGSVKRDLETRRWCQSCRDGRVGQCMLALVLVSGTDNERVRKALYYFEPNNQPAPLGQEGKNVEDPDDLRVLAQVLEAQKTDLQRKRAIDILESLADKNLASPDDRFRLAQLCERSGDWPRAREKYRELNSRTKILPEMETLNHRSYYVAALVDGLLRHHQSGDEQNLAEAKKLVDEIKQLQPDALGTVQLQVRFYEAQNQRNKAAEVIRAFAGRSNLTVQELQTLAYEAEKLGQLGLAEQLFARHSYARGFGRQASTGRLFQSP